ncbi:MAG: ATP-binding cassette domain-containing protein, partial [Deltaproteobacteria bacterium]|nr:ATP-binding cassette domain-containing protein [Deltaproteobacteria bacterium]
IQGEPTGSAREKALSRLREVELTDFVHHRPDKMSGGQRQRVAIARALVTEPDLIIADEPTANLDSGTSHRVLELMRSLNDSEGTTFLFSTHDPRLLDQVKRLVRLEDGRIVDEEVRP